jgi:transcriptional antiterminator RfaH
MDWAPYWCAARTEPRREAAAAHFLGLAGYTTYLPRLRERRSRGGRRIIATPPLFPSYVFVRVELGWWRARWCVGVADLVTTGGTGPARVPDRVIDELKDREVDGCVALPEPPRFRAGDPVRITRGPFSLIPALYQGMASRERVMVLLQLLGAPRVLYLPETDIEPA